MNTLKLLLISILLTSCNSIEKENKLAKEKAEIETKNINDFIPTGFEIVTSGTELNKIESDLNEDGISDYVILLASGKNNGNYSNSKNVRLAIFEGQKDGSFKLKSQTGNLTSSFLHVNPNKRVTIANKNVISLEHQSMRHDYKLKIRYQTKYKNYMLIGSEYNNYGNAIHYGAGNISSNFITAKRISTIKGKKITQLSKELKPISAIDDYNIYALISE